MVRMTATEVARNFSAVLNQVTDGEEVEITRNGAPVATLRPPSRKKTFLSPQELRELFDSLPPVDEDFARDIMEARRSLGPPEGHPWPS